MYVNRRREWWVLWTVAMPVETSESRPDSAMDYVKGNVMNELVNVVNVRISTMKMAIATASILLLVQIQVSGDGSISAEQMLEQYSKALTGATENIAFDIEVVEDPHENSRINTRRRTVQRMGNQMFVALDAETHAHGVSVDSTYLKSLTTDQELFSYSNDRGEPVDLLLVRSHLVPFSERIRYDMGICRYIEGDAWDGLTIVEAMRQAPSLRLRDNMELINGHQTYVLEAQDKENTYVMWIDPEYGFNPRKIEMIKYNDGKRDISESKRHLVVNDINIEKINGKYIIMSAEIMYKRERYEGGTKKASFSVRRTNVNFNPDFSKAAKEFWEGVPDGTPVFFEGDERGIQGVRYEWFNGQVRAKVDEAFLDQLDQSIDTVKTDSSVQVTDAIAPSKEQSQVETSNGITAGIMDENKAPESQQHRTFLIWAIPLLIGLSVMGLGVLIFVRRKRVN